MLLTFKHTLLSTRDAAHAACWTCWLAAAAVAAVWQILLVNCVV